MTLYELTEQFKQLLEIAETEDIPQDALNDTFESIELAIEDKAENTAIVIKELEAEKDKLQAEEDRLSERRKSIESNIKRLKLGLQAAMQTVGKPKFKTKLFSFNIQKNAPAVILDSDEIPSEFLVPQDPKVNKTAIAKAIKSGQKFDFAHLERSESLRIR